MRKKNALWISLVIPIFFSMITAGVCEWTMLVYPDSTTVDIDETFAVYLNVTDVVDMYAYEFRLFYDSICLDGINVTFPPGHFLEPVNPAKILVAHNETMDDYNATHGRIYFAASLLAPEAPRSGNGTLVKINFKSTTPDGPFTLKLLGVKMYNSTGQLVLPSAVEDGEVTVIPEFPAALITPLFMVLTLVAVILRKTAWLRKRRNSSAAE